RPSSGLCSRCQIRLTPAVTTALTASLDDYPTAGARTRISSETARTIATQAVATDDDGGETVEWPISNRVSRSAGSPSAPHTAGAAGAPDAGSDHGPLEPGQAFGCRYHIIRI